MRYWLVKQEPEDYSWADLVKDQRTAWTGVRNFEARKNLREMARGDLVLFYHSTTGKEIVGVSKVARTAYPDPSAQAGDWSCVDLAPARALPHPVSLATVKADRILRETALSRRPRLSVMPLSRTQFERVLRLGGTKP